MRPVIPFILYFIGIIATVCWAQNCEYDCIPGPPSCTYTQEQWCDSLEIAIQCQVVELCTTLGAKFVPPTGYSLTQYYQTGNSNGRSPKSSQSSESSSRPSGSTFSLASYLAEGSFPQGFKFPRNYHFPSNFVFPAGFRFPPGFQLPASINNPINLFPKNFQFPKDFNFPPGYTLPPGISSKLSSVEKRNTPQQTKSLNKNKPQDISQAIKSITIYLSAIEKNKPKGQPENKQLLQNTNNEPKAGKRLTSTNNLSLSISQLLNRIVAYNKPALKTNFPNHTTTNEHTVPVKNNHKNASPSVSQLLNHLIKQTTENNEGNPAKPSSPSLGQLLTSIISDSQPINENNSHFKLLQPNNLTASTIKAITTNITSTVNKLLNSLFTPTTNNTFLQQNNMTIHKLVDNKISQSVNQLVNGLLPFLQPMTENSSPFGLIQQNIQANITALAINKIFMGQTPSINQLLNTLLTTKNSTLLEFLQHNTKENLSTSAINEIFKNTTASVNRFLNHILNGTQKIIANIKPLLKGFEKQINGNFSASTIEKLLNNNQSPPISRVINDILPPLQPTTDRNPATKLGILNSQNLMDIKKIYQPHASNNVKIVLGKPSQGLQSPKNYRNNKRKPINYRGTMTSHDKNPDYSSFGSKGKNYGNKRKTNKKNSKNKYHSIPRKTYVPKKHQQRKPNKNFTETSYRKQKKTFNSRQLSNQNQRRKPKTQYSKSTQTIHRRKHQPQSRHTFKKNHPVHKTNRVHSVSVPKYNKKLINHHTEYKRNNYKLTLGNRKHKVENSEPSNRKMAGRKTHPIETKRIVKNNGISTTSENVNSRPHTFTRKTQPNDRLKAKTNKKPHVIAKNKQPIPSKNLHKKRGLGKPKIATISESSTSSHGKHLTAKPNERQNIGLKKHGYVNTKSKTNYNKNSTRNNRHRRIGLKTSTVRRGRNKKENLENKNRTGFKNGKGNRNSNNVADYKKLSHRKSQDQERKLRGKHTNTKTKAHKKMYNNRRPIKNNKGFGDKKSIIKIGNKQVGNVGRLGLYDVKKHKVQQKGNLRHRRKNRKGHNDHLNPSPGRLGKATNRNVMPKKKSQQKRLGLFGARKPRDARKGHKGNKGNRQKKPRPHNPGGLFGRRLPGKATNPHGSLSNAKLQQKSKQNRLGLVGARKPRAERKGHKGKKGRRQKKPRHQTPGGLFRRRLPGKATNPHGSLSNAKLQQKPKQNRLGLAGARKPRAERKGHKGKKSNRQKKTRHQTPGGLFGRRLPGKAVNQYVADNKHKASPKTQQKHFGLFGARPPKAHERKQNKRQLKHRNSSPGGLFGRREQTNTPNVHTNANDQKSNKNSSQPHQFGLLNLFGPRPPQPTTPARGGTKTIPQHQRILRPKHNRQHGPQPKKQNISQPQPAQPAGLFGLLFAGHKHSAQNNKPTGGPIQRTRNNNLKRNPHKRSHRKGPQPETLFGKRHAKLSNKKRLNGHHKRFGKRNKPHGQVKNHHHKKLGGRRFGHKQPGRKIQLKQPHRNQLVRSQQLPNQKTPGEKEQINGKLNTHISPKSIIASSSSNSGKKNQGGIHLPFNGKKPVVPVPALRPQGFRVNTNHRSSQSQHKVINKRKLNKKVKQLKPSSSSSTGSIKLKPTRLNTAKPMGEVQPIPDKDGIQLPFNGKPPVIPVPHVKQRNEKRKGGQLSIKYKQIVGSNGEPETQKTTTTYHSNGQPTVVTSAISNGIAKTLRIHNQNENSGSSSGVTSIMASEIIGANNQAYTKQTTTINYKNRSPKVEIEYFVGPPPGTGQPLPDIPGGIGEQQEKQSDIGNISAQVITTPSGVKETRHHRHHHKYVIDANGRTEIQGTNGGYGGKTKATITEQSSQIITTPSGERKTIHHRHHHHHIVGTGNINANNKGSGSSDGYAITKKIETMADSSGSS